MTSPPEPARLVELALRCLDAAGTGTARAAAAVLRAASAAAIDDRQLLAEVATLAAQGHGRSA